MRENQKGRLDRERSASKPKNRVGALLASLQHVHGFYACTKFDGT